MQQTVYLNNKFIPAEEAKVSAHDAGFLFGAGVFETILGSRGRLFYFHRHYARLRSACAELGIKLPFGPAALRNIVLELLTRNQLNGVEARVKILATPGDTNTHLSHREGTVLITVAPYMRPSPRIPWKLLFDGLMLASPTAMFKSTSYLPYRLALHAAHVKGYDDAIFLDRHGMVSETSIASLLLFRGEKLVLPQSEDALRGVTRGVVAEIAREKHFDVEERPVSPAELIEGYAVCVCNALLGPFPVGKINDTELPVIQAGLLESLRTAWTEGAERIA